MPGPSIFKVSLYAGVDTIPVAHGRRRRIHAANGVQKVMCEPIAKKAITGHDRRMDLVVANECYSSADWLEKRGIRLLQNCHDYWHECA
jgi:hypothetical protein